MERVLQLCVVRYGAAKPFSLPSSTSTKVARSSDLRALNYMQGGRRGSPSHQDYLGRNMDMRAPSGLGILNHCSGLQAEIRDVPELVKPFTEVVELKQSSFLERC